MSVEGSYDVAIFKNIGCGYWESPEITTTIGRRKKIRQYGFHTNFRIWNSA